MLPRSGGVRAIFCSASEISGAKIPLLQLCISKLKRKVLKKIFAYFAAGQDFSCLLLRQFEVCRLSRAAKRLNVVIRLECNRADYLGLNVRPDLGSS
jgi:hypothetical protein